MRLGLSLSLTNSTSLTRGVAFDPASLSPTAWYDPSDLSTLWQDTAGTTPVTADGQSVARIDDKSGNGFHLTQDTAANRPLYKTDGTKHWLQFDGTNDSLSYSVANVPIETSGMNFAAAGVRFANTTHNGHALSSGAQRQDMRGVAGTTNAISFNAAASPFSEDGPTYTANEDFAISASIRTGGALEVKKNGTGNGATTITGTLQSGPSNLFMGSLSGGSEFLNGRIYGAAWVGREPVGTEEADLANYMRKKAGA